jgi:hypothetical protein
MAIHHVHMDYGAATPLGRGHLVCQVGKIR